MRRCDLRGAPHPSTHFILLKAHATPPNDIDPQYTGGLERARSPRPRRCQAIFDGTGRADGLRAWQACWSALCSTELRSPDLWAMLVQLSPCVAMALQATTMMVWLIVVRSGWLLRVDPAC